MHTNCHDFLAVAVLVGHAYHCLRAVSVERIRKGRDNCNKTAREYQQKTNFTITTTLRPLARAPPSKQEQTRARRAEPKMVGALTYRQTHSRKSGCPPWGRHGGRTYAPSPKKGARVRGIDVRIYAAVFALGCNKLKRLDIRSNSFSSLSDVASM